MEEKIVDLAEHKYAFAIPAYDGKINVETSSALIDTTNRLTQGGVSWNVLTIKGCALIDATRNELCHKFLHETDADIMICVDSDVSWDWESMQRLLIFSTLYPTVAGIYCSRTEPAKFHLNTTQFETDNNGLLDHSGTGMGFVSLQRSLLENLDVPTYKHPKYPQLMKQFFKCEIQNDVYTGEDIVFFRMLAALGYKPKADINITLRHHGSKDYDYQIKDYIFKENLNGIQAT